MVGTATHRPVAFALALGLLGGGALITTEFALTLGAFMFATVMLYVFIGLVGAQTLFIISPSGHAWRLAVMLFIGSALSAAVA
jgi:hypothetical protein